MNLQNSIIIVKKGQTITKVFENLSIVDQPSGSLGGPRGEGTPSLSLRDSVMLVRKGPIITYVFGYPKLMVDCSFTVDGHKVQK